MSASHTPGRLTLEAVESDTGTIRHLCPVDKDRLSVLTVVEHEGAKFAAVYLDDDARRLVACWNACDGVSTAVLENLADGGSSLTPIYRHLLVQKNELLEALKVARDHIDMTALEISHVKDAEQIRAALKKAEGEA